MIALAFIAGLVTGAALAALAIRWALANAASRLEPEDEQVWPNGRGILD